MLKKNPLCPPLPHRDSPAAAASETCTAPATATFVSAEDYDGTGILAGVDPCESRYWWLPELISATGSDGEPRDQATSRSRPATAVDA